MDDPTINLLLGRREKIDEAYVRREAKKGRLSDEAADLICRYVLRSRGRNFLANAKRDISINIVVEALQEEGASFRAACARVAPFVNLSASAIISVCQKERRRNV